MKTKRRCDFKYEPLLDTEIGYTFKCKRCKCYKRIAVVKGDHLTPDDIIRVINCNTWCKK